MKLVKEAVDIESIDFLDEITKLKKVIADQAKTIKQQQRKIIEVEDEPKMKYPYFDGSVTWVSKDHWYWGDST